jgi:hypothetical protein
VHALSDDGQGQLARQTKEGRKRGRKEGRKGGWRRRRRRRRKRRRRRRVRWKMFIRTIRSPAGQQLRVLILDTEKDASPRFQLTVVVNKTKCIFLAMSKIANT